MTKELLIRFSLVALIFSVIFAVIFMLLRRKPPKKWIIIHSVMWIISLTLTLFIVTYVFPDIHMLGRRDRHLDAFPVIVCLIIVGISYSILVISMIISGAIKLSKRKLDPKNTSFEDEKARKLFLRTNDDPELFKREVMVDMVSKTVCFSFTTKDIFKENSVPYKTKKSISISQITKISTKSRPGGGEKITFRTTVNGYGFFSLIYDSPKATEIANKIKSYIINDSE